MKIYFPKMISLFAIATTLMLSACGGGGSDPEPEPDPEPTPDTTKPAIVVTTPSASGQTYALSGTFQFDGTFTDNEALKQVVFSLSDNKPASSASLKVGTGVDDDPWTPADVTVALTGKTQTLSQGLFGGIPAVDIWTGVYTLTITCTDAADNVSEVKTIDVTIE